VYITKNRLPIKAGLVGLVSQNYILFRHRTIMGNLRTAALMRSGSGMPWWKRILTYVERHKKAEKDATEMLTKFDDDSKTLVSRMDLYPSQFSGGQRQRIAIAQQLLCSEHFLLMDEPTGGLDPLMKKKVCDLIVEVANQDDLNSLVIVTHDIRSALSFADTIWVMGRNRDAQGKIASGAKIKYVYDLVERGLTWNRDAMNEPEFVQTEKEILELFEKL
jgi:polar amino acid transport system ATP-binding protein/sulfate transport system ATP-binding protein